MLVDEYCKVQIGRHGFQEEPHDWRLWSRERRVVEGAPSKMEHWKEEWYCTKCRQFEEREVHES